MSEQIYASGTALDDDGDVTMTATGVETNVENAAAVAQRLRVRLETFRGTWFADLSFGIPYFEHILGKKNPNLVTLNAIFVEAILTTPGVARLKEPITYDLDTTTRVISLTFTAILKTGEEISLDNFGVAV